MSMVFIIAALVLPAEPAALASSTPTPTLPIFADEMTAARRAATATPKVNKRKAAARRYGRRHQRHDARHYPVKPSPVAAPVAQPTPALIAAPPLERSAMARIQETFASTAVPPEDARPALPAVPPIVGITPFSGFDFAQVAQFETDEPPLDLPMWWLVCAVVMGALVSIVVIRASEWRAWRASPLGRMCRGPSRSAAIAARAVPSTALGSWSGQRYCSISASPGGPLRHAAPLHLPRHGVDGWHSRAERIEREGLLQLRLHLSRGGMARGSAAVAPAH
jgi:hypothetical protein